VETVIVVMLAFGMMALVALNIASSIAAMSRRRGSWSRTPPESSRPRLFL